MTCFERIQCQLLSPIINNGDVQRFSRSGWEDLELRKGPSGASSSSGDWWRRQSLQDIRPSRLLIPKIDEDLRPFTLHSLDLFSYSHFIIKQRCKLYLYSSLGTVVQQRLWFLADDINQDSKGIMYCTYRSHHQQASNMYTFSAGLVCPFCK